MSAEVRQVAGELYALPLAEFTAARNRRAAEARASGRAESGDGAARAKAIRGLPRASLAAWVVNLLVREDPGQVDRILALGERLRQAQKNLDAEQLRELGGTRRKLIAAVTRQARDGAARRGVEVSAAVAAQVEHTLHAALIDEYAARAVRTALLVKALPSSGLDEVDIAGSVAVPDTIGTRRARLSVVPAIALSDPALSDPAQSDPAQSDPAQSDSAQDARAAAIAVARSTARRRHAARARRDSAGAQLRALQARDAELADEAGRLEQRLAELRAERDGVEIDLVAGRERLRHAEERYEAACEEVARARAALDAIDGDDVP